MYCHIDSMEFTLCIYCQCHYSNQKCLLYHECQKKSFFTSIILSSIIFIAYSNCLTACRLICANIYRCEYILIVVSSFYCCKSTVLHFPFIRSTDLSYSISTCHEKENSNQSCITWKIDSFQFNINLFWLIWLVFTVYF